VSSAANPLVANNNLLVVNEIPFATTSTPSFNS